MDRADKVFIVLMAHSDIPRSSEHDLATIKRSKSWSARDNRSTSPPDDNDVPPKAQSCRLMGAVGDYGIYTFMSVKDWKSSLEKYDNRPQMRTIATRDRVDSIRQVAVSKHNSPRPSWKKGTKESTKGTYQLSKKTKKAIGKVKGLLKIPSWSERKKESKEKWEDLDVSKKPHEHVLATQAVKSLPLNTLTRSISHAALLVESCHTENTPDEKELETNYQILSSQEFVSPRRKPRSKKDGLSVSEHVPRSTAMHTCAPRRLNSTHRLRNLPMTVVDDKLPTSEVSQKDNPSSKASRSTFQTRRLRQRDILSQSDHVTTKSSQVRRRQSTENKAPVVKRAVQKKDPENASQKIDIAGKRSTPAADELIPAENMPSQSTEVRGASLLCSWGDLTLTCDSDSEGEFSSSKKFQNPHFSWDLSQLATMEDLLSEQADKEDSKKDKLKSAFSAVKKKMSGSVRENHANARTSLNDSCDNVHLFDDSYQQDFLFESIGSGILGSRRNSNTSGVTDVSALSVMASDANDYSPRSFPVVNAVNRSSTENRESYMMDRNETMEPQNSSESLKSPLRRPRPSRPRRSYSTTNMDVESPPQTKKTVRSSSTRRRRNGVSNSEKKPSSWRDLYSQSSPGQGKAGQCKPTSSSQGRRTALKKNREGCSLDEDIVSPRTVVATEILSNTSQDLPELQGTESEATSELLNIPISTAAVRRQQRRSSTRGSGYNVAPSASTLEAFYW